MFDITKSVKGGAENIILELDLTRGVRSGPFDPVSSIIAGQSPHLSVIVDKIDKAGADDRVVGLIAKVGAGRIRIGMAQEIRAAVARFRAAGKRTVAWAESFGEFKPGMVPYYLATAFETIYLQPSGDVGITGITVVSPFLRDALDRTGVRMEVDKRHEYKTAGNALTEPGFTEPHREADERLVASLSEQLVEGIAADRKLSPERVRALIDQAPLLAAEALEAGLVDGLRYRDEIYDELHAHPWQQADGTTRLRYLGKYSKRRSLRVPKRNAGIVAEVHVHGTIRLGRGGAGPQVGSDTATAALRAAIADDKVKAIVLRVDSPGGSYAASDAIWREVARAGRRGKPVVGHISNVAASGGYYVLMAADVIVSQPAALTGSIGVFGGKPVIGELLERLGISIDGVGEGRHSRMFSKAAPFTQDEWSRMSVWLDRVYADFVDKAATGRDMARDRMHALAKGRVWTGADARDNGLVDQLGDYPAAVAVAKSKAGLPPDAPVKQFPNISPLRRLVPARSSEEPATASMSLALEPWGPLAGLATRIGLPVHGPLLLPAQYEIY